MSVDRGSSPAGPAPEPGEAILVAGLRRGEDWAFERLVRDHGGQLLAVARRLLRNEADARDAVQEALLSAFRSIGSFKEDSRVSTWLHRITVNAALIRIRSRQRRPEQPIEDLLPRFQENGHHAAPVAPWPGGAEARLLDREARELVRAAIDRLPETFRNVLLLRDIEGLETGEAARLLGVSDNAVKIRLHRARQALREQLAPHFTGRSR